MSPEVKRKASNALASMSRNLRFFHLQAQQPSRSEGRSYRRDYGGGDGCGAGGDGSSGVGGDDGGSGSFDGDSGSDETGDDDNHDDDDVTDDDDTRMTNDNISDLSPFPFETTTSSVRHG